MATAQGSSRALGAKQESNDPLLEPPVLHSVPIVWLVSFQGLLLLPALTVRLAGHPQCQDPVPLPTALCVSLGGTRPCLVKQLAWPAALAHTEARQGPLPLLIASHVLLADTHSQCQHRAPSARQAAGGPPRGACRQRLAISVLGGNTMALSVLLAAHNALTVPQAGTRVPWLQCAVTALSVELPLLPAPTRSLTVLSVEQGGMPPPPAFRCALHVELEGFEQRPVQTVSVSVWTVLLGSTPPQPRLAVARTVPLEE